MKKNIENIRLFSWIYLLTTFSAAVIIHPELSLEMDSSASDFSAYGRRSKCRCAENGETGKTLPRMPVIRKTMLWEVKTDKGR